MSVTTSDGYTIDLAIVTTDEIGEYTNGRCGQLARAIAELTGWKLAIVGIAEKDEDGVDTDTWDTWCHVVAVTPEGSYLDAHGLRDGMELVEQWLNWAEGEEVYVWDVDDFDDFEIPDIDGDDDARELARRILCLVPMGDEPE